MTGALVTLISGDSVNGPNLGIPPWEPDCAWTCTFHFPASRLVGVVWEVVLVVRALYWPLVGVLLPTRGIR